MGSPLILWLICDGKPGHENQSLGLAEAICRLVPGEIHLPTLWLAHKNRARSIVLMRPSLPMSWFDLCIAPEHDFPNGCERPNVILTRGAINRITPVSEEKTGKLILIGGPSKSHDWDGEALLDKVASITGDGSGWELTDSRRTPEGFLGRLREKLPGITAISHSQTPPDWVPEKLRDAREVWVTEDSVSMIYEALTSGANVGLLPLPRRAMDSRVLRGIDGLLADGCLTPFPKWADNGWLQPSPQPLHEADRCAEMICSQWMEGFS